MSNANVTVVGPHDSQAIVGPQGQQLVPCVTTESCGSTDLSAGMVVMPPATNSLLHHHVHTNIVVMCVRGWAATLIGPELQPRFHGPGEFIYVPAGVLHMAVNLSVSDALVAVEVRTDPNFNDDVVVAADGQVEATAVASAVRDGFDGTAPHNLRRSGSRTPARFDVISTAAEVFVP